MKRRYIAIIVVLVSVAIFTVLKQFYPNSYEWLYGYLVAVSIGFKSALVSFFIVSKLKIVAFLKSLTFISSTILILKRWFLDNIFSKWLEKNIINNIKDSIKLASNYYKNLNFKEKIKNILLFATISTIIGYISFLGGYLDNLLIFTELKLLITGASKAIVAVISYIGSFIINSWITPIVEVFALSFILNWLEDKLGSQNLLVRFFNKIESVISYIVNLFVNIDTKLDSYINEPVAKNVKYVNSKLTRYIDSRKIDNEYKEFEKLEQKIMKAHIDSYFSFKGMDKIKDKKELYRLINKKSKDSLNIVAYLSRNSKGELLDEDVDDSYYHDIFILEGLASSSLDGIKKELSKKPDSTDFWVLNSSNFPVTIISKKGDFKEKILNPNSLNLIKTTIKQEYGSQNICFKFKGKVKPIIMI